MATEAYGKLEMQFISYCRTGNLEGVRTALENGLDVNTKNPRVGCACHDRSRTGLIWALLGKHNNVVQLLLNTPGIDVNYLDCWRMTAMHAAVEGHNYEGLAMLLTCPDLDVNPWDKFKRTPLWRAIEISAVDCMQLLLGDERVDPNINVSFGPYGPFCPALNHAVMGNNIPLIHSLLANPKTDPNTKDGTTWSKTPLMNAVKENKEDIVHILLADPRVDLNTTENFERKSEDLPR